MLVDPTGTPIAVHGSFSLASVITPVAALGAAENDYTPLGLTTASVLRLTAHSGGGTLSGLIAPTLAQLLWLWNISTAGADSITLLHENTGSIAANRFLIAPSLVYDVNGDNRSTVSITIPPNGVARLWYDLASVRWRVG